jgi:protein involved in polysaccharide export with SLBB domain
VRFLRNILRESSHPGFRVRLQVGQQLIGAAVLCVAVGLATAPGASAQVPTPEEAQRLTQQNPALVRQQLLQSGLSEAEIRAQLQAAGYPQDFLDQFLPGDSSGPFNANGLRALETLGPADGFEVVSVTSGMQMYTDRPPILINGLPIFGLDVFTRASTQFQPLLSGPAPDDYVLGPDDEIVLILTGDVELAHELVVTREGFVVVPNVGRITVANLTMAQVRVLLRDRMANSYSGIERGTMSVAVTLTQLRTIQIYVTGEVAQAGAYQMASVATVTNALYAAGGPTQLASLRDIRVQRRSGEDVSLDLYPYLLEGHVSEDVILRQGDVVFVPLKGRRVQLHGAVVRPAHYELSAGNDLIDVLSTSGGFAPEADRQRLTVHRVVRPGDRGPGLSDRIAIDLALTPSTDPGEPRHLGGVIIPPISLQDGDSIVVDAVLDLRDRYYVSIVGMVAAPDTLPWREGMTIRDLLLLARGPTVGADLHMAQVSRLPNERGLGELADALMVPLDSSYLGQRTPDGRYVGPPGVTFPAAGSSPEFILQPFDQVLILRQPEFEMPQSVTITGEVPIPGKYTLLTKNDRVTDLISRARGLLETGYPEGARFFRPLDDLGRINLDLPAAMDDPSGQANIFLQPGDSLHIPEYSPTVVVTGAVNSPITVLFREGQGFGYYVANAGGYRNDADKSRVSVRYANGLSGTRSKFLFWSSYPEPGPGSVVSVPIRNPADRFDTIGLISNLVGVLGSLTTVIVVLTR